MPEKNAAKKPASKKKKTARTDWLIACVCALVFLISAIFIVRYYRQRGETQDLNSDLLLLLEATATPEAAPETVQAEFTVSPTPVSSPTPTPAPTPVPEYETSPEADVIVYTYPTPPAEIDPAFNELHRLNPDMVGHLRIPSTSTPIDLFVVQRDNDFYLDHDFYGKSSRAGTLFLDMANSIWPQDQHMMIYGHNMKDGTMFARLTKYKSIDYTSWNPFVYFDTLYEKHAYAVVAALRIRADDALTADFNLRSFFFEPSEFDVFVSKLYDRALYKTNVDVNSSDHLLTLVTCSYWTDDERFVLVTRRLRENETEEDIKAMIP